MQLISVLFQGYLSGEARELARCAVQHSVSMRSYCAMTHVTGLLQHMVTKS